ncbi:family 78 glycoside hydrolase catalytic domain [Paenibacillus sp. RUD330]|nr:family 78 glycoside hydrolase catalytic domain [Paenibacillus sp. RUD330]
MNIRQDWVDKAEALTPALAHEDKRPVRVIEVHQDDNAFQGWATRTGGTIEEWKNQAYGKGDSFILDFGDHWVGYMQLSLRSMGSPPDAPMKLKLTFGEMPCEVAEPFSSYDGWLSSSWLQEELLFVDILPAVVKLPRRYCFRYLKIEVLDTSVKYKAGFDDIVCVAVTSANASSLPPLPDKLPEDLRAMDRIAVKTLQDCMQTVFEDGPKRDRRLWIGDLRLQAQANYATFRNFDLVKRCLYLFAGMRLPDGAVAACVFEKPHPHADDTRLYDYSLLFAATLHDYYEASGDMETLRELWPIALEQLEIGLQRLGEDGAVVDDPTWWCFTDWHGELNKQASAQAVLIYSLKRGQRLAEALGLAAERKFIAEAVERTSSAALDVLLDPDTGLFASGQDRQISWASQVWMALAEVLPQADNARLLRKLIASDPAIGMTTPYMAHHFVEALFEAGLPELALEKLRSYWGGMMADGADTFWELYNPDDKKLSPYGSNLINSYCHAWSCTPSYFIRTYMR